MGNAAIGAGGDAPLTQHHCASGHVIDRIEVRSGDYVNAVRARCTDGSQTPWVGGAAGNVTSVENPYGITGYGGRGGQWVDQLKFQTGAGGAWTHDGGNGGNAVDDYTCKSGDALNQIHVRSNGQFVDQIQFWCGPFTQMQAVMAAKHAQALAAQAAQAAQEAAVRAAAEAAAKAAAEKVAADMAAKAAADAIAAKAAADAAAAAQKAAAEKAAADAAAKAAADKIAADMASKAAAEAQLAATAASKSSIAADAASAQAAVQANAAIASPDAATAGVAARAAQQSAQNAVSAAAEATKPVVDTKSGASFGAKGGEVKVDGTGVGSSYMIWVFLFIMLVCIIAAFAFMQSRGASPASNPAAPQLV
jgi:hypothetical protein